MPHSVKPINCHPLNSINGGKRSNKHDTDPEASKLDNGTIDNVREPIQIRESIQRVDKDHNITEALRQLASELLQLGSKEIKNILSPGPRRRTPKIINKGAKIFTMIRLSFQKRPQLETDRRKHTGAIDPLDVGVHAQVDIYGAHISCVLKLLLRNQ